MILYYTSSSSKEEENAYYNTIICSIIYGAMDRYLSDDGVNGEYIYHLKGFAYILPIFSDQRHTRTVRANAHTFNICYCNRLA